MFELKVDDDLVLRLPQPTDAKEQFLVIEANRAHLRKWLPWLDANTSVGDSRSRILSVQAQFRANRGFVAGIRYRGELVGIIGHHDIDWANKSTVLGYWLAESAQGKGIMTRSCAAVVTHAFKEYRLNRVEIRCAAQNVRSRAIPERLGFQQEGIARSAEWLYDHYVDLVVYGLLQHEWNAAQWPLHDK